MMCLNFWLFIAAITNRKYDNKNTKIAARTLSQMCIAWVHLANISADRPEPTVF